jgi:hypothetical protein
MEGVARSMAIYVAARGPDSGVRTIDKRLSGYMMLPSLRSRGRGESATTWVEVVALP